jgi:hypothetical protein
MVGKRRLMLYHRVPSVRNTVLDEISHCSKQLLRTIQRPEHAISPCLVLDDERSL